MHVKRNSTLPKNGRSATDLSELSTSELVALAQAGDREAFDPLYRRFADRLLGYVITRTRGDRALAEDITSEVWVRVIAYAESWQDRDGDADHRFFGLLCASARQRLGQHYNTRWRETCHGSLTDADEPTGQPPYDQPLYEQGEDDDTPDPADPADRAALVAQLRTVVDGLNLTARQVVQLRLDGLNNAQIAARLDMTAPLVNNAWQRATRVLRLRVSESFTEVAARAPERVRALADLLPEPLCKVALLRLDGVAEREVAERLGLTYAQARRAWVVAKDEIRRRLADPQYGRNAAIGPHEQLRMHEVAQTLPELQRQVALLRLAGQRNCEIAQTLGCSNKAVTNRWRRARVAFEREGIPVAA